MTAPLPDGLYESVVTPELRERLAATTSRADIADIPDAHFPGMFGRHVGRSIEAYLESLPADEQQAVSARIIAALASELDTESSPRLLRSVWPQESPIPRRPSTALADGALLTNARDEPRLGSELALEMESADSVDLLCAFVKFPGIRILEQQFANLRDRGVPFRVITTTYMGATDRKALDVLVREFDAELKVRYEMSTTRLHAKAWLFRRNSGFDTAYVGSSNLSRSALVDGLEWNVRLSAVAHRSQILKFGKVFDSYWDLPEFESYSPETDGERLDTALREAGGAGSGRAVIALSGLEVRPYPHQQLMLNALDTERTVFDRHRNLLVAATGTGKTVVAALDYVRLCPPNKHDRPTLLFVAHRKEILVQALRTYREALGDGNFGELFVDGDRPLRWKHVFASVQSLSGSLNEIPKAWEVIVIDEFHHAHAAGYRRIGAELTSTELLGLTATPERHDGVDVRALFDGRSAYELRLWDALEQDLLCPFHYYGIADNIDLRGVGWQKGNYDQSQLSDIYTGNHARVHLVLKALQDKVVDPSSMKALGFCVSIDHARFMAEQFTAQGINAVAVIGTTLREDRLRAVDDLRAGRIQCIFTVDVFNEGVDIPAVDVVLMLRPTASATVYVQQLGRGLRRSPGKALLTVLDFVGQHRADFDLSTRFTAMTGHSRRRLVRDVETEFPSLPGASRIVLDAVTKKEVLDAIKRASAASDIRSLCLDITSMSTEMRLAEFLHESHRELDDIYRTNRSWVNVVIRARHEEHPENAEQKLLNRLHRLRTVDDPHRIQAYSAIATSLLAGTHVDPSSMWTRMLVDLLLPQDKLDSYEKALARLSEFPRVLDEIVQLMEAAVENISTVPEPIVGLHELPLRSHARYHREELLAAIGHTTLKKRPANHREGVAYSADTQTDLLLINMHKSEKVFSPSTMYRDVPVSPELFDWESQSTTSQASPTGRRYLSQPEGSTRVILAVRNAPDDEIGTAPFTVLGTADLVSYKGDRPIQIRWKLRRAMPPEILAQASVIGA
ncbi:MAG: DUF3427 domain-containing protein [Actinomycetia bacterium]|nr:DUF3427 domain-containing protein [Actinomycetes bacterium]